MWSFTPFEIPTYSNLHTRTSYKTTDAFPWGAWPQDAAVTHTSKQAGKALRSQGHQCAHVM